MAPILEWTTPTRQNHTGILPLIPIETYEETFECVAATSDPLEDAPTSDGARTRRAALANLSLVCRLFCSLSLQHLFHTTVFHNRTSNSPTSAFARALVQQQPLADALAPLVRTVVLADWPLAGLLEQAIYRVHTRATRRLPDVTKLVIRDAPFGEDALHTVCQAHCLKSLRLQRVTLFPYDDEQDDEQELMLPSLEELDIFNLGMRPELDLEVTLEDANKLRVLRTDSPQVLRAVLDACPLALRVLDVDLRDARAPLDALLAALNVFLDSKAGRALEERSVRLPA
ncbi:hypothetical protein HDZ31DRAFT_64355 [Schizophyllum fasciatum]